MSEILKWLEEESDRLAEECHSNADPHKTVNNSFLEGFNYALANVQGLEQPQLNENQQIVLEWLRNEYTGDADPFGTADCLFSQAPRSEVIVATLELTRTEQAQVLELFSRWAQEQEGE
ncbi:hypothetical protein ACR76W_09075 [Enterococcus casseliflavus]|uniref:hypothetical protein n=1 Tax=Enterococcus casseliflavus TaxID=37734 RepID=UPI003DA4D5F1